ncbi:Bifunctional folate synthesis protein [Aquimixticola soesokkakensis]|uniref:2-amino-4-hydroxy-6-hydroxymethyldihydropteridine pyrophosphokinase n=1 Tax=Aquimixticola soesokkakensis TaxID=1519096 RepID=A0A1Y5RI06_9RHOB|nr:2-amino-4-hydroxy-6-hydroxymethyldihydropteridine diphosphokinase [Aquimixticola soesokkakensis]SLN17640.1 Bifunctional folate synthesis protein [Aquimixticola soesokkakensis]
MLQEDSAPTIPQRAFLALGANIRSSVGGPTATLRAALEELTRLGCTIVSVSPFYTTPAFPSGAGPDFANLVAQAHSSLSPHDLLALLHRVEAAFGRKRERRWGERCLDIDLLAVEDQVLPDPQTHAHWRNLSVEAQQSHAPQQLVLPHPRIQDRGFVLIPWADIAPDWRHPVLGQTVAQMCEALPQAAKSGINRLK